jgi:uncharacterized protein (DUF2235 family)
MTELQDDHRLRTGENTPSPKNIVICLDGTNCQIGVSQPTNVAHTYEMLSLLDPTRQIAYYDPGVGTLPATTARGIIERRVSRIGELAFGIGIRAKLIQAYTWLMQHYRFGDNIYIFGFSRGAYTARALVGMLNRPGLLRPGSENLVPYAVRQYATNKQFSPAQLKGVQEFADAFCWGTVQDPLFTQPAPDPACHANWHAVPVQYLGVWDTVEAAGVLRWGEHNWPFTHDLPNAKQIRHAVAINEWRGPYRTFPIDPARLANGASVDDAPVQEVWFAGVHSDIGGTYPDDSDLARIALKWVIDGAVERLILREHDSYSSRCDMRPAHSGQQRWQGRIHPLEAYWILATRHRRTMPTGAAIHQTALDRTAISTLTPSINLPADSCAVDKDWQALISPSRLQFGPSRLNSQMV